MASVSDVVFLPSYKLQFKEYLLDFAKKNFKSKWNPYGSTVFEGN